MEIEISAGMKKASIKTVATIEARLTSSRLPGKVLLPVLGKPILQILIERLKRSDYLDEIVVATTTNCEDDPIATLAKKTGVKYYRGSEQDVLDRVCMALKQEGADVCVAICGDSPFIDPKIVSQMVEEFFSLDKNVRFYSNSGPDGSLPWGFDFHIFKAKDIYEINKISDDPDDHEHVGYHFYRKETGNKYHPHFRKYTGKLNRPELRVVLDYKEDFELIKKCYCDLIPKKPEFTAEDVIDWIDNNPSYHKMVLKARNSQ